MTCPGIDSINAEEARDVVARRLVDVGTCVSADRIFIALSVVLLVVFYYYYYYWELENFPSSRAPKLLWVCLTVQCVDKDYKCVFLK